MTLSSSAPTAHELLAANVVMLRARRRLSQSALAGLAKLSRGTISNIERADGSATVEVLERLAQALSISVPELFSTGAQSEFLGEFLDKDQLRSIIASEQGEKVDTAEGGVDTVDMVAALHEALQKSGRYSNAGRPPDSRKRSREKPCATRPASRSK